MSVLQLILLALALSMDAFAVALGVGAQARVTGLRPAFRLWFHFGLFQALMTIVGWFLGVELERRIAAWDHWVAFVLLAMVGGKMIKEGLQDEALSGQSADADPTRGLSLVSLSVATSLDALAVGTSLGMLSISAWYPGLVIGLVTALISLLGIRLGRWLGRRFGKTAEIVGGAILVLIGLKILLVG